MSENDIKPVAWRYSDLDEEFSFTDDPKWAEAYPDYHAPLYDQQAIDRLTAERDAALADAERYRYLRDVWGGVQSIAHTGEHRAQISTPSWRGDFDTLDGAIDAARAKEPQE